MDNLPIIGLLAILYVFLFIGFAYSEIAHAKERKDLLNRIIAKDVDEYARMDDCVVNNNNSRRPRNFIAAHQRKNGIRKTILGDESQEYPDEF